MTEKLIPTCVCEPGECDIVRSQSDGVVQLNCLKCGAGHPFPESDVEQVEAAETAHKEHGQRETKRLQQATKPKPTSPELEAPVDEVVTVPDDEEDELPED